MPSVPIKQAIESQSIYCCMTGDRPPIEFRIRFLSLEKLDIGRIDEPDKIDKRYDLSQGNFLILRFELISLFKEVITSNRIYSDMLIVDQDEFKFSTSFDRHLTYDSILAKEYDFNLFISTDLVPKIKYKGAIPFYVPKEDHAEYGFSIHGGSIQEI